MTLARKDLRTLGGALLLALLLPGCGAAMGGQEPDPPAVAEVNVGAPSATVEAGTTVQLDATARDAEGNVLEGRAFAWATQNAAVATVSEIGLVMALAPGQVEIRATAEGITGSLPLTVSPVAPRTINVSTAGGLRTALGTALPGDSILLAPGTYTLISALSINRSGTADQPITIQGAGWASTVIDVDANALTIDASYLRVRKLRLTRFGQAGLRIRDSHHNVLDSLEIDHTNNEALAFKNLSKFNVIMNSRIHDTGITNPQFGEAVYVGGSSDPGYPTDFGVTDNQVLDNHFGPNVRAQAVDVKGGSHRTVIRGNTIDGMGTQWLPASGSGSLIDIEASEVIVEDNQMQYGSPNGIRFLAPVSGTMTGVVVSNNTIDLQNIHDANVEFYAFNLTVNTTQPGRVTIRCSNTVTNGPFSNVTCVP